MTKKITVEQAWQQFIGQWQQLAQTKGFPTIEPDDEWPSPCQFAEKGVTKWQPVKQADVLDSENLHFNNVEQAINFTLNQEFKTFFTLYFSEGLEAEHDKGQLYFLQAWSKPDFERLQQNLIGHLIMKTRLKQPPTLFFACTEEEDLNLVVDNETGQVCLEYVGKEPHQVMADSLAEFILQTKPVFLD